MLIVSGTADELSVELFEKMAQYRHRVFVENLGWELQVENGRELDQFDHEQTIYVLALDEDTGDLTGVARLLPTNGPYLLGSVFPQLLNGLPPPNSSKVWELSRFATVDFNNRATYSPTSARRLCSAATVQFLHAAIAIATKYGAERLITVSPLGIERLLRNTGVHAHRAGPPTIIGGHPIFACWIEIAPERVPRSLFAGPQWGQTEDRASAAAAFGPYGGQLYQRADVCDIRESGR
jgi:acyl homoserine lactone synthase